MPNKFAPSPPRLAAGRTFAFPSQTDGFEFTLNDPGKEKITAICNVHDARVPGVSYDFSKEAFPSLGSEAALNAKIASTRQIIVNEIIVKQKAGKKPEPPAATAEARRAILLEVK